MHPTGTHGLVARPYEPLADSHAGGPQLVGAVGNPHGPTKPFLCSRFREHMKATWAFIWHLGDRSSGHFMPLHSSSTGRGRKRKARALRSLLRVVPRHEVSAPTTAPLVRLSADYFTSTFASASSIFFFIV